METHIEPPLALLGIEDTPQGKAPETRMRDGHDARRLLSATAQEDQPRAMQRAVTKALVDGKAPYDDVKRRAEGRGWECNLNFMEGEAIMDSSAVPYYSLFANVPYYVEARTNFQPDHPDHEEWNAAISARYSNLYKRWKGFDYHIQQISYWMRLHGIGFAFRDKPCDWRFRAIETGSVLAPKGAPSCIDKRLPFLIVRVAYRIHELWDFIKDEKTAADAGWDVEGVKNAIKHGMKGFAPSGNNWMTSPWEHFERILKNNELTASFTDADLVHCGCLLVQEFAKPESDGGKISRFIFTEFPVIGDNQEKKDDKHFLYCDPNCYDEYQDALVGFFQNTGDGTWHSVRGIAMKAFKHLEVSNRLMCQTVNRGFIDSSLVIESASQRNSDKISLTVWGSIIRVPAGGEIKPTAIQGGTSGVMEVNRMIRGHLGENIAMFKQSSFSRTDGKGEVKTATEVNQQVAKESTLSMGQMILFFQYLDQLYDSGFKIAADSTNSDPEAKRFVRECIEDGVPKEALADMEYVRANRQSGYGSPQMGLLKQQQMMAILPMLPEDGKQNWLEDAVTLIEGPEKVKRYAPRQHIPNQDDSIAALENGLIQEGREPVIAAGQDDVIHLTSHLKDAADTLSPIDDAMGQGQSDPAALQKAYQYVQIMGAHCEAHLARLANDKFRQKESKLFQEQLMQIVAFSGKLRSAVREAMRTQQMERDQQQQATALDAITNAKVNAIQSQTQIAAEKARSQIENQRMKTMHTISLKGASSNFGLRLDAIRTAEQIRQQRNKELVMPNTLNATLAR